MVKALVLPPMRPYQTCHDGSRPFILTKAPSKRLIGALCFLFLLNQQSTSLLAQDQLRIAFYNLLNFPDPVPAGRADTFAVLADYMEADLLMVCELKTAGGAELLLDRALNTDGDVKWRRANFVTNSSGASTLQNLVFYRQEKLTLIEQQVIRTHVRDINHYRFLLRDPYLAGHRDSTWLDVYVAHLKAGNSDSDQASRSRMADSIRKHMDFQPAGRHVVLGGDFNVYSSTEPAYVKLTDPYAPNWIRDPINRGGNWNSNPVFADLHTQSTRTGIIFGDGSGGGMDDRFDQILLSSNMLNSSARIAYKTGSYKAVGNSGNCYNMSIFSCEPNEVSRRLRSALYYMSDHLPVILDLDVSYPIFSGLHDVDLADARNAALWQAWFNGSGISFSGAGLEEGVLQLFASDGRLMLEQAYRQSEFGSGSEVLRLDLPAGISLSGVYLLRYEDHRGKSRTRLLFVS